MVMSSSPPDPPAVNPVVRRLGFMSAHYKHEHIIRDVARYVAYRQRRYWSLRRALAAQRGRRGWR
jgi:hypothetical protein